MKYQGCAASRGVAIAKIFCYGDQTLPVEEKHIDEVLRRAEVDCYHAAIAKAEAQLQESSEGFKTGIKSLTNRRFTVRTSTIF